MTLGSRAMSSGATLGDQATGIENQDPIRDFHDGGHIVLHEKDRHPFGDQRSQADKNIVAFRRVEARKGFVSQQ